MPLTGLSQGPLRMVAPPVFAGGESTSPALISTALCVPERVSMYVTYRRSLVKDGFGIVDYVGMHNVRLKINPVSPEKTYAWKRFGS